MSKSYKSNIFLKHKDKTRVTRDENGNKTRDHWDGRKDVKIVARPVNTQLFK